MTALAGLFDDSGRTPFLVGLTAGDPGLETTAQLLAAVERAGVDGIVLEVPYSDPLAADELSGRSLRRALDAGTTLQSVLAAASEPGLFAQRAVPVVLSAYAGPVVAYGVERFAEAVTAASLAGVMLVDVPVEEMQWFVPLVSSPPALIHSMSPSADRERLRAVAKSGSGFVCLVADEPTPELPARAVRKAARLPVVVASAFTDPEAVTGLCGVADGLLALAPVAAILDRIGSHQELVDEVERRVGELVEACHR